MILMASNEKLSQLIASRLESRQPEGVAELSIQLWQAIAAELLPIIGSQGFAMLYARSLHLAQSGFAWLAISSAEARGLQRTDLQFTSLKTSLEGRSLAEVGAASQLLLITFTNLLIVLIGEPLTTSILHTAWGEHASDIASKESSQ